MKKNVVITVRGLQRQVDDDEPVEVISAGTYLRKENIHYLSYEEADEDGKITKNRIKITADSIEMTKQGGIATQMIFVKGDKIVASVCGYADSLGYSVLFEDVVEYGEGTVFIVEYMDDIIRFEEQ